MENLTFKEWMTLDEAGWLNSAITGAKNLATKASANPYVQSALQHGAIQTGVHSMMGITPDEYGKMAGMQKRSSGDLFNTYFTHIPSIRAIYQKAQQTPANKDKIMALVKVVYDRMKKDHSIKQIMDNIDRATNSKDVPEEIVNNLKSSLYRTMQKIYEVQPVQKKDPFQAGMAAMAAAAKKGGPASTTQGAAAPAPPIATQPMMSHNLNEMAYVSLKNVIKMPGLGMPTDGDVKIDTIDMRFEDYDPNMLNNSQYGGGFKVELPNNQWIISQDFDYVVVPDTLAKKFDLPEAKSNWWNYASGMLGNEIVKQPKNSRFGPTKKAI